MWQFEYLRDRDLPRDASFLDYGCGPAAAGIFFIEYLDAGKYVGTDISEKSIEVGREFIESKLRQAEGSDDDILQLERLIARMGTGFYRSELRTLLNKWRSIESA